MKHIKERAFGYLLEIKKGDLHLLKRFLIRDYNNKNKALEAAISYRDRWYEYHLNQPVLKTYRHSKNRNSDNDDLPSGISIYKINDIPYYYVVTDNDENGKQYKYRYSIKKLGNDKARLQAIEKLNKLNKFKSF